MVLQLSSMKTLHMWSSSMPHVGPLIGANMRTLFWRCKRIASEREYIWYPYTRGSENPSKKSAKKLVRGPLLSKEHRDRTKNEKVCNLQKLLLLERARIESCIMRGTLSGRRPRDNHGNVLWKKRVFFQKRVFFSLRRRFWPPGANFGASLRRPNWPCLEYLLRFYKISFKKCAAAWRDAISA